MFKVGDVVTVVSFTTYYGWIGTITELYNVYSHVYSRDVTLYRVVFKGEAGELFDSFREGELEYDKQWLRNEKLKKLI